MTALDNFMIFEGIPTGPGAGLVFTLGLLHFLEEKIYKTTRFIFAQNLKIN